MKVLTYPCKIYAEEFRSEVNNHGIWNLLTNDSEKKFMYEEQEIKQNEAKCNEW